MLRVKLTPAQATAHQVYAHSGEHLQDVPALTDYFSSLHELAVMVAEHVEQLHILAQILHLFQSAEVPGTWRQS